MNIIVCIKQVPDTSEVRIDPVTNTIIREGVPAIINPFDENAIEEALLLREEHGGKVTVITMGPPQAETALREALAMGADEAILVSDRCFAASDTLATSYVLSSAIREIGDYDLILTGKQAFDGDTAQVPPGIAEQLGIPQVTFAIGIEAEGRKVRVRRLLEDEFEVVEVRTPVLVSCVKQMNEPRRPGIKSKLAAKKKEIVIWDAACISAEACLCGFDGSPTRVVRTFAPTRSTQGKRFEGEARDSATAVVVALIDEKII
ncbi:MAG: electron transfer flavoprotein subunit beta/FixA family protein [candidate division WS1 bacterium]|jgi:electron transfer flavoprotein beta subunit|nr:electron transfer flavoprotein subunit beta/FixA family protein [candidate division WS1 bacterium]